MAKKKIAKKKKNKTLEKVKSEAKFPYSTKPASLRRFLQQIPQKPKPQKIDRTLLHSWGFKDANDHSMVRVLKSIDFLNEKNEPTELYSQFMQLQGGASALDMPIKKVYEPLFNASHKPYNESPENLRNLFHINSGGSERSLEQQIQTFKALCDSTSFSDSVPTSTVATGTSPSQTNIVTPEHQAGSGINPTVNINLHIHLPENKSRRDYENMIEDIGRYIFGRNQTDSQNDS